MIELKKPDMSGWTDEQADEWYNRGNYGSFGTRNSKDAIETFDSLLEPFGLQVGHYDGDSDYQVSIVPLAGGPNENAAIDVLSQKLEDAISHGAASEAQYDDAMKKIDDSIKALKKSLDGIGDHEAMPRALVYTQIDYAVRLQRDIRGY